MGSTFALAEGQHDLAHQLAEVAAYGLRPSDLARLGDPGAWGDLLVTCENQRLLGILADAVRAGSVPLDAAQVDALESRYRYWLAHDLVVEAELLRALRALQSAGIQTRVLKGVALAHTVYGDPSRRVFADADILVDPGRFSASVDVLAASVGAMRLVPELRAGFDDRFGREATMRVGPVELDLHRTLVDGPYGLWIPLDELFADPIVFVLGGTEVEGLGAPQRFVHACLAAVLGDWPPRMAVLRDIAEMLIGGPTADPVDADAVWGMAGRWRAKAPLALAICRAVDDLRLEIAHPLVELARRYRPTIRERVLLASYRGRARGYTSQALSVLAIRGWRNRWDYTRAVVRPGDDYLRARGFRRGDRFRRALGLGGRRRRT